MSDTPATDRERLPVLFVAAGRQRVGKTTFLNALVQYVRERGSAAALWNADQQNTTNNLAIYHPDVQVPSSQDPLDVQAWLEGRIQDQVENRYDAILDVGGGESAFSRLIRQERLAHSLRRRGIRIVLANVLGPDQADVDYLASFTANDLFVPDDVLVVFNGGLILSGRSVKAAFEDIWSNPVVASSVAKGARTMAFPALGCMQAVTDQALLFAEAMNNKVMEGHKPLSFLDQDRVAIWWERDVPAVLGALPPTFLPAMGGEAAAFAYHPPTAEPLGAAAD